MIKVNVKKEKDFYQKITIVGHALYDDYGKDIVCSACSSIVTTTVNGVLTLNKNGLIYEVNDDGMTIIVKDNDQTTQKLIHNMINLLKELEENYPNNIKVK